MRGAAMAIVMTSGLAIAGPGAAPASEEAAASASPWRLPTGRFGTRTAPLLLLSRPDIQADLELDAEQVEGAHRAILDVYTRAADLRGRSGPSAIEARRRIDEAAHRWLEQSLTDPQRARLAQLDLQWEGARALASRGRIAEALGLTERQREQLRRLVAGRRPEAAPGDPVAAANDLHRRAVALLSDEQRDLWAALLGPRFAPRAGGR